MAEWRKFGRSGAGVELLIGRIGFVLLAVFLLSGGAARADYYVWRDVDTGLSLSFPDTWLITSSADSNDILTVMPPSGRGNAMCRVRADRERRWLIYPPYFSPDVQETGFSRKFWERYLAEYSDHHVMEAWDGEGLGRGYAGYAIAAYSSPVPGPFMARKALMFATLYYDKAYVLECSSHRDAFGQWKEEFLSVAKSVDFKEAYDELMTGNYRNFMEEPPITFSGDEGANVLSY